EEAGAGEPDQAEEVLCARLPARHEAAASHQPGEEPLDVPATFVPAELAEILSLGRPAGMMWRNQLDAASSELGIERVAVVRLVPDQLFGERLEEACLQRVVDELRFMSCTTRNPARERKAIAVCHCHDLGRLAASS